MVILWNKELVLVCLTPSRIKKKKRRSSGATSNITQLFSQGDASWRVNWPWCIKSAPLRWLLTVCYIKQCWSYIIQPLAEAELLTHCFNSILMSFLAQRGKKGGRHGHKPPTFLFLFKTFHKGSKNMPPKNQHISKLIRLWLPNVYSFRKMFISLPSIFCVSALEVELCPGQKIWGRPTCQMLQGQKYSMLQKGM